MADSCPHVCDSTNSTNGRADCNGHGDCVHEQCWCDVGYTGTNCSLQTSCQFWDERLGGWSSANVSAHYLQNAELLVRSSHIAVIRTRTCMSVLELPQARTHMHRKPPVHSKKTCTHAYAQVCSSCHLTDFAGVHVSLLCHT